MSNEEIQIKAKELVEKYYDIVDTWEQAKQCALIATQNTIDVLTKIVFEIDASSEAIIDSYISEQQSIKQAIENL
jgi:hypothetical protein